MFQIWDARLSVQGLVLKQAQAFTLKPVIRETIFSQRPFICLSDPLIRLWFNGVFDFFRTLRGASEPDVRKCGAHSRKPGDMELIQLIYFSLILIENVT